MQQLYAEIKRSSKYAHQVHWAKNQGESPFKVHIEDHHGDGYAVHGGPGGQYRLEDVNLFVIDSQGRKVHIK